MGLSDRTPPTPEEFDEYPRRFSNWGRWGDDDELGTLNHITPEVRQHAATLVRDGRAVSLGRAIDTFQSPTNPYPAQYMKVMKGSGGISEYLGIYIHGQSQSHLDAFSHAATVDGKHFYNGVEVRRLRSPHGLRGSVHHWRDGIVTRGVLYDVPRLRGTDYVEPGAPVHGWELEDAARAQGVEPRPGDAVLIRSGLDPYLRANPEGFAADDDGYGALVPAGVHVSAIEYLYDHDAAVLGWDMLDAPIADQGIPNPFRIITPIHLHQVLLPYTGMPLVDNLDLEPLAAACAEAGRWEMLLTVAPLIIEGGTGSPVNPIALL
jgi:kynurenine formamidase